MKKLSIFQFQEFIEQVESLATVASFYRSGFLIENRPQIFHELERIITGLDKAIQRVWLFVDRLDVCLDIKKKCSATPHRL